MDPTLAGLLAGWNNVEIARSFARFLTHPVRWLLTPRNQPRRVGTIDELKSGFFEGWIRYSDPVVIQGRLSRFAPIYFPIAYSPQVPGGVSSPDVLFSMQVYPNPAPAAFPLRHVDGGILAFLFPVSATGTPRITSPFHLDRMGYIDASGNSQSPIIPWSLAEPCVPVLLDRSQLRHLENITEITAVLAPLDPAIESALTGSHEDFVRLYYHGF
jgi:hypothetical protein